MTRCRLPEVIGILLIGFNRPDLLEKRLFELLNYTPKDMSIHLSLDGARASRNQDFVNQNEIIAIVKQYQEKLGRRFTYKIQPSNLGCDAHIYKAITEEIKDFEAIICLEDDIQIGSLTVSAMVDRYKAGESHLICGMSSFKSTGKITNLLIHNKWRRGRYFSAWGYLVSQEFWKDFKITTNRVEIENKLKASRYWRGMPTHKRNTWTGRFQRGNIDYQIQLESFTRDLLIDLPIFRIIENTGLGDPRATHTYHKRPKNMFGLGPSTIFPKADSNLKSNVMNLVLNWVDSNTWAGDGFLSVRGRSAGARTLVKRALKTAAFERGKRK